MSQSQESLELLATLTADIVSAHASNNSVKIAELPALISNVYAALSESSQPAVAAPAKLIPAVSVRSSIKADYIICLEDGKQMKMLKRHLMTAYGMTPDDYRTKWSLPANYPMVAPNYAEVRSALANKLKFGSSGRGGCKKIALKPTTKKR